MSVKSYLKRFKLARDLNAAIRGHKPRQDVDLAEIERRRVAPNDAFHELRGRADSIEGMLSPFSMSVLDMLLCAQEDLGARGNILEIGTYRGKSAVILGSHLRDGERLTLVDIHRYLDPTAIAPFEAATDFILTSSDNLRKALPDYSSKRKSFRFIHIDASHGYRETFNELAMAEQMVAPMGIISLDDFTNLNYSQNIAAIFKYLFTASKDLALFLVTDEKGYVCRKSDLDTYLSYVFNNALAQMHSREMEVTLARTCFDPEYSAFYLRPRQVGEFGFYGPEIYRVELVSR